MKITKELLEKNEFVKDNQHDYINLYNKYVQGVASISFMQGKKEDYTNSGRQWDCHIDNCDFESIAWAEIDTLEQFNSLCDCMDIDSQFFFNDKIIIKKKND